MWIHVKGDGFFTNRFLLIFIEHKIGLFILDDKRKRGVDSVETVYPMAKKRRLRNADD
jgi:hypothetical protein